MSGTTLRSIKVVAKLLCDLFLFSIFFSDILLHCHESIQVVPQKYLMYFLSGVNAT